MDSAAPLASDGMIENRTFDEIAIGESASLSHTVTQEDIDLFAIVSGDVNPAHMDPAYAKTDIFHKVIAHGMLGAGLISSVLGTKLPGPGTIYLDQDLHFLRPLGIGDTMTATLKVTEKACGEGRSHPRLPMHQSKRRARHQRNGTCASSAREGTAPAGRATRCAAKPARTIPRPRRGRGRAAAFANRRRPSLRCQCNRGGGRSRARRPHNADPGRA